MTAILPVLPETVLSALRPAIDAIAAEARGDARRAELARIAEIRRDVLARNSSSYRPGVARIMESVNVAIITGDEDDDDDDEEDEHEPYGCCGMCENCGDHHEGYEEDTRDVNGNTYCRDCDHTCD